MEAVAVVQAMRARLKGINVSHRYRKDGSKVTYYYHRATGTRLKGSPGSSEFIASIAEAEKSYRNRSTHDANIHSLIRQFEDCPEYQDMRESSRYEYRRKFRAIDKKWGTAPIVAFEQIEFRKDVIAWRDEIAKRAKREADNLVSALSRLGAFAVDRALIERNVIERVKKLYRGNRADVIWLPEPLKAFAEKASPEIYAALMLGLHTGQRQGDLRRLPWSAYDGERIKLTQSKTKRFVSIRCTQALREFLDGQDKRSPLILTTRTGKAWAARHLRREWDKTKVAAGLGDLDLHFHDLRGTTVTLLAKAGSTIPQIAAVTGHSLKNVTKILERYLARTEDLADAAILKFDAYQKNIG